MMSGQVVEHKEIVAGHQIAFERIVECYDGSDDSQIFYEIMFVKTPRNRRRKSLMSITEEFTAGHRKLKIVTIDTNAKSQSEMVTLLRMMLFKYQDGGFHKETTRLINHALNTPLFDEMKIYYR